MTDSQTALSKLLEVLTKGTVAGTIQWEQADHRARAFIARRRSGTVTLYGPGGETGAITLALGAIGPPMGPAMFRLVIKNASGNTIEEFEAGGLSPVQSHESTQLRRLYARVHEGVTGANATLAILAAEFSAEPD